jgi:hypothetical protein
MSILFTTAQSLVLLLKVKKHHFAEAQLGSRHKSAYLLTVEAFE